MSMKTKKSKPEVTKTKVVRPSKTVQNQVMSVRQVVNAVRLGMKPPVAQKPNYGGDTFNKTLANGYDIIDAHNDIMEAKKIFKETTEARNKARQEARDKQLIADYEKQKAIDELNKKIAQDKPLN